MFLSFIYDATWVSRIKLYNCCEKSICANCVIDFDMELEWNGME